MMGNDSIELVLISARNYKMHNQRECFLMAMSQLNTIMMYQPDSSVFQTDSYKELNEYFESLEIN